ncbi:MAG: helix-turn-helix transcriptional regulator [Ktedonobacterales bacterium]
MELSEKLRRLRANEGLRRGRWRSLTQREVATALQTEQGATLSQAYLSQLEQGRRGLSDDARATLARFYGVHPGYLVSDPDFLVAGQPATPVDSAVDSALDVHRSQPSHANRAEYAINHAPNGVFGHLGLIEHAPELTSQQPNESTPTAHLLVALRDHPDPQRVLLMMERLLRLSVTQLATLERAVEQAEQVEQVEQVERKRPAARQTVASKHLATRNVTYQPDVFQVEHHNDDNRDHYLDHTGRRTGISNADKQAQRQPGEKEGHA